jgi:hypothetical protein
VPARNEHILRSFATEILVANRSFPSYNSLISLSEDKYSNRPSHLSSRKHQYRSPVYFSRTSWLHFRDGKPTYSAYTNTWRPSSGSPPSACRTKRPSSYALRRYQSLNDRHPQDAISDQPTVPLDVPPKLQRRLRPDTARTSSYKASERTRCRHAPA